MNAFISRIALAAFILVAVRTVADAQVYRSSERTWHATRGGLLAGFTSAKHSGDVPMLPVEGNTLFSNGSGGNFTFGLLVEKALSRFIALGGSVVLDPMDASITRTFQDPFRIADAQGNLYDVSRRQTVDYTLRYVTLKGYAKLYPSGGPGLFVGGSLGMGMLVKNSYKNSQMVVRPEWAYGSQGPSKSGELIDANGLRYTVGALLGYEFFFNYGFISPQIQYDLPLNNVVDASWADTWDVSNIRALVSITFPLP